jgi:hypothetical protein
VPYRSACPIDARPIGEPTIASSERTVAATRAVDPFVVAHFV